MQRDSFQRSRHKGQQPPQRKLEYSIKVPDIDAEDQLIKNLQIPPDAAEKGAWSDLYDFPIIAIHSAPLPDGSILTYGASIGNTYPLKVGRSWVTWDPTKGYGRGATQAHWNNGYIDSLCTSSCLMPDGQFLSVGGSSKGKLDTVAFDYTTHKTTKLPDLHLGRWYATLTKLGDGSAVIAGGSGYRDDQVTPELWDPSSKTWKLLPGAKSERIFELTYRYWYPQQWLTKTGTVFGISGELVS